jgi:hypothetical protein
MRVFVKDMKKLLLVTINGKNAWLMTSPSDATMNIQRERTLGALSAQCEAFRQAQSEMRETQSETLIEKTTTTLIVATPETKKEEQKSIPPSLPMLPSHGWTATVSLNLVFLVLFL